MIFPTPEFTAFFVVVLWISWRLMPHPGRWKPFILAASYVFYGYADVRFTLLLAAMTAMNQLFAVHLHRATSQRASTWLIRGAVAGNLAVLGWFKYYGFFVSSVAATLNRIGLPVPLPILQVALPVGVSFFTFQALSYVIDVHRRVIQPAKPLDFAVYLAFFPHLMAEPIVQTREFLPQLASPRDPRKVELGRAVCLIVGGLFKKVVLADMLATRLVDPVFGSPSAHGATDVLLAVYAYGAQIYCDFSSYTDMATGLALLLGFQFPRNFNAPYTATSLQDFWRRWHMTLSRWLRDYLYIPLGGNRRGEWRTRLNLMLTMLLGGLWHGAAWNFVIWGGIHGTALVVGHPRRAKAGPGPAAIPAAQPTPATRGAPGSGTAVLEAPPEPAPTEVREPPSRRARPLGPLLAWLVTQHVVLLAWVFFRAPDLHTVGELAVSLWSGAPSTLASRTLLLAVLSAYAVQWVPESWHERIRGTVDGWGTVRLALLLASAVLVATALMPREGVAPFIYFRF